MAFIHEIVPLSTWNDEIRARWINQQFHPTLPLMILDYSPATQYGRHWNEATLMSRGLIVNSRTGEIVSRPFSKFFNSNEPEVQELDTSGGVRVTDKLDGSMGVSYPTPDGLQVSTRGSFQSDQAVRASRVYTERYNGKWEPRADRTYIWEIIYPSNRIVVDYGDLDDLVLIAAIDIETGASTPASQVDEWVWRKVEELPYGSLQEAVLAPERPNREGFVVQFVDSDARVKVKHEEYKRLHRTATGVSPRRIWELLKAGDDLDAWLVNQPDEFVTYVNEQKAILLAAHSDFIAGMQKDYETVVATLADGYTQKDFALSANKQSAEVKRNSFIIKSAQPDRIAKLAWDSVKPPAEKGFWASSFIADEG